MHTKFWSENVKGIPLGKHGHRWEDNIRMDHMEIALGNVD